jgi:hypothetical protein
MSYAKGSKPQSANYAKGGAVLGKYSAFMKSPDEFRNPDGADGADEDDKYGKEGDGKGAGVVKPPAARSKQLSAVKPRK